MMIPDFVDLLTWAASLLIDFPNDNLPILYNEREWKDWGNEVIFSPTFERLNAPRTDTFINWVDWAYALYQAVGFSQG